MDFAEQVVKLAPEGAYFMLAKAQALEATGREIIHLEIGQPDVPTFDNISQAGVRAIQEGYTRYTPSAGMPSPAPGDCRRRLPAQEHPHRTAPGSHRSRSEACLIFPHPGAGAPR